MHEDGGSSPPPPPSPPSPSAPMRANIVEGWRKTNIDIPVRISTSESKIFSKSAEHQ
ncbi:MAG: hypothetical protein QXD48_03815 [Candidatus Aenigmatarchaeota archaeon]